MTIGRREFLAGAASASLLLGGRALADEKKKSKKDEDEDEVPPTEDLMREHGVLRRILLVYGEAARRIDARQPIVVEALAHAATIVREFIEDYHERDEEDYVFPAMEKAHQLADLTKTLRTQHQAGRRLTADVLRLAAARDDADKKLLATTMRKFIRMYEPHAAFEDTVLFPAFREVVGEKQLAKLQDIFEDKEKALPHGGFEKMVDEVAKIEIAFGIHDLALFTP